MLTVFYNGGSLPGMFNAFSVMFTIVFVLILGVILFTLIRSISQWNKNNHSPKLTVPAKVVSKRTHFRRSAGHHHHVGHGHTNYYVTFEVQSGDRMELQLQGTEFGMLAEGDCGELTFQGTRFLGFVRKVEGYDL